MLGQNISRVKKITNCQNWQIKITVNIVSVTARIGTVDIVMVTNATVANEAGDTITVTCIFAKLK